MSFLTPLFLVGLAALAIPVLIHLVQRERRQVVEFPSLMFLRRIPYRSVRRRRIDHWLLLLVRLAALLLIIAAFARPFLRRAELGAVGSAGLRDVVILIDTSYSMGYGERWRRAQARANDIVSSLRGDDRAAVVAFASEPEVLARPTTDRGRVLSALAGLEPSAGATQYGPALKLAASLLADSALPRREVVLISDFQRAGWRGTEGVRLPRGAILTAASVDETEAIANATVTPVSIERSTFSNQERVAVKSGALNRGTQPIANLAVTLELDGRAVETQHLDLPPGGSRSVTFAPFTLASRNVRGTVRLGDDALARDNVFHFIVSPTEPTGVLVVGRQGARPDDGLYLRQALAIGDAPRFAVTNRIASDLSRADLDGAALVVLDDVPISGGVAERLAPFVERGGGVLVVLGEHAAWPSGLPALLPALPAGIVDRTRRDAARIGMIEYAHPVFEIFRTPRSGDFSAARFYTYRALETVPVRRGDRPEAAASGLDAQGSAISVLARFDDGAPALMERRIGRGRVLLWATTLDLSWSDLPLRPVFLPFVHRAARYLSGYTEPALWRTVGQVVETVASRRESAPGRRPTVALTPSGRRVDLAEAGREALQVTEQGFYEIRPLDRDPGPAVTIASNVDLSESDLTRLDPREIAAAVTGATGAASGAPLEVVPSDADQERAQRIWWYLLFAGVLLLGMDTLLSNRLSRA